MSFLVIWTSDSDPILVRSRLLFWAFPLSTRMAWGGFKLESLGKHRGSCSPLQERGQTTGEDNKILSRLKLGASGLFITRICKLWLVGSDCWITVSSVYIQWIYKPIPPMSLNKHATFKGEAVGSILVAQMLQVVFECPVRSGFLMPKGFNRNRNRSAFSPEVKRPNRTAKRPQTAVFCSL